MDVELRNQQCNLSQNPKIPRNIIPISLMVLIGVSMRRKKSNFVPNTAK